MTVEALVHHGGLPVGQHPSGRDILQRSVDRYGWLLRSRGDGRQGRGASGGCRRGDLGRRRLIVRRLSAIQALGDVRAR